MICSPDIRRFGIAAALALALPAAAANGGDPLADARAALQRGDGIAAEVAAKQAITAGLPQDQASALIGEAELLQEDYRDARRWLQDVGFSPDTAAHGFHVLALLEMAEGNLPEAGRAFDRARELGNDTPELWVDIARLRYSGGEHQQAREAAIHAVELGPDNARAIEFRALVVRDSEGLLAALPWFERGLKANPGDLGLMHEYAATLGEIGRAKEMLRITRRMIELDPENPHAFYLQAVLAARAGMLDLSRRLMLRTGDAYDDIPAGIMLTGILELKAGNTRLAVERFAELVRRQPDNARFRMLLARALLDDGEPDEVIAEFGDEAGAEGASPYLVTLVGRAYEQLGQRDEAARYLDKAAAAQPSGLFVLDPTEAGALEQFRWGEDPSRPLAMISAIRTRLGNGDIAGAQSLVSQLEKRFPGSMDVAVIGGDVALAAGDAAGALKQYRSAALVRKDFSLVLRMAQAQAAVGAPDEILAELSDYLRQHPRSGEAAGALARVLAQSGDWKRARVLADYAIELGYGVRDPGFLSLLAAAQLQAGEAELAQETAWKAYRLQRANGRVAAALARIIDATDGDSEVSAALLAKAQATAN